VTFETNDNYLIWFKISRKIIAQLFDSIRNEKKHYSHSTIYHSSSSMVLSLAHVMDDRPHLQCESKKSPHRNLLTFFSNGWEFLVQILHAYYTFLSMLDYKFLFSYLQLWRSYAMLSATTIICSKCPPSTEMHAGWSHLIWHNFIKVADNWIKICSLA